MKPENEYHLVSRRRLGLPDDNIDGVADDSDDINS